MDIEWIRRHCLSLAHTTEQVQWESLVFKVGGKMYALVPLEPQKHWLWFKASPEEFTELIERPGVTPAPYLARAHWVALETGCMFSAAEAKQLVSRAHTLIFSRLPMKTQAALARRPASRKRSRSL